MDGPPIPVDPFADMPGVCPECGWGAPTSDGRCLNCPPPPEEDEDDALSEDQQ